MGEVRKLSPEQERAIESSVRRGEPVAVSAMTLLEIAHLADGPKPLIRGPLKDFFQDLSSNPTVVILPLSYEVALEAASLRVLRDPGDRAIAATALVHGLDLVTSDQRIIESNLVPVVE